MPTLTTAGQPIAGRFPRVATVLIGLGALAAIMAATAGRASALNPQPEPPGVTAAAAKA